MRYDTLAKKPKVYNIGILSIIAAILVVILIVTMKEKSVAAVGLVLVVYTAAALVLLMRAWVRQIRYNPYSYNTIYYLGFSLFLLSVVISLIIANVQLHADPEYSSLPMVFGVLEGSARNFMLLSAPLILVISVLLFVSNISLIRHEGRRFVNILGIILSFLLIAGEVFLFLADYQSSGSEMQVMIHDFLISLFAAFYLYFECMVIGAAIADYMTAKYEPDKDKDYMIILGCGIRKDGTPTPLLKSRIDRALRFYKAQIEQTGKALVFIPSGGQGKDEIISESECMRRYLLEQGIPDEQILKEEQSTSTQENMKYSKEMIDALNPSAKVAFSTTNYHVFRSGMMARRVKMKAQGIGAPTKWYFWPNAAVREFVGLLTQHRGKQILILLGMVVVYLLLTFLRFHI